MRKADLRKNHSQFERKVTAYWERMRRLLKRSRGVRKEDKKDVAESVIVHLCALWEQFVDMELVDCLNLRSSVFAEHLGAKLPKHLDMGLCHALLIGAGYLDFRSIGDLKGYTKKILAESSNPFLLITGSTGKRIDEAFKMRNYLVHYSSAAKRALLRIYKGSHGSKQFRRPGNFLLAGGLRHLESYVNAFVKASSEMRDLVGGGTST